MIKVSPNEIAELIKEAQGRETGSPVLRVAPETSDREL